MPQEFCKSRNGPSFVDKQIRIRRDEALYGDQKQEVFDKEN